MHFYCGCRTVRSFLLRESFLPYFSLTSAATSPLTIGERKPFASELLCRVCICAETSRLEEARQKNKQEILIPGLARTFGVALEKVFYHHSISVNHTSSLLARVRLTRSRLSNATRCRFPSWCRTVFLLLKVTSTSRVSCGYQAARTSSTICSARSIQACLLICAMKSPTRSLVY
jgi:hypothetical protein